MNYANTIDAAIQKYPDRMAVSDGSASFTYAQFGLETELVAGALASMGLRAGDAILVLSENRSEHLVLLIAAARLGLVYAAVHHGFQARELSYVIGNSQARVAFVEPALLPIAADAVVHAGHQIEKFVTFGPTGDDAIGYDDFRATGRLVGTVDVGSDHPLVLIYTSGTTTTPKPVLRSHAAETWSAESYRSGWNFEEGDRVLVALSLAWSWGLSVMSQSALVAGASVRLLSRFNPVRVLEVVEQERITTFAGTVSMYPMLLDVLEKQPFDTSSLRKLFSGGEARNEVAIAKAEKYFGLRLFEGYALSECFPALVVNPEHGVDAPVGTPGRVVAADAEIRLVDEDERDVPAGEVGQALLRSPGRMLEYFREPELTAERITDDGWVRTGDLLRLGEDGYYFFVGRSTDMIIRGGANISPLEIEAVLMEHAGVQDAMVVGLPNVARGEEVVAAVIRDVESTITAEQLISFIEKNLAKYKVPQRIVFVNEMPMGKTGKKNRKALRAMLSVE